MNSFILLLISFAPPLLLNADNEAIQKQCGALHFFSDEFVIRFELDLTTYHSNAKLLHNNSMRLNKKCEQNPKFHNCQYFKIKLEAMAEYARKETQYLQSTRDKRELCMAIALLALTIGAVIVSFIAGVAVASSTSEEMLVQQNLQMNTTKQILNYESNSIDLYNRTVNELFSRTEDMEDKLSDVDIINQIIMSSVITADEFNRDTVRFQQALSNDLKENFFKVIDLKTFNDTLHEMDHNSQLSEMHPNNVIKLSNIDSYLVNNTIVIEAHVPIISKQLYQLIHFIPIPIIQNQNNFILNMDSKYLIKNNSIIREMSLSSLAQCLHITKFTACNTLIMDQIMEIDNCTRAIIRKEKIQAKCIYQSLPNKSQIIRLTQDSVYVHMVKPILLKIACGQRIEVFNVTKSTEITHEKHCNVFNPHSNQTEDINSITIKIRKSFSEPKFLLCENKTCIQQNIFLNEHNSKVHYLMRGLAETQETHTKYAKLLRHESKNIFAHIANYFNELTDSIKIYLILIVIAVCTIFLCCILCICRR